MDILYCQQTKEYYYKHNIIVINEKTFEIKYKILDRIEYIRYEFFLNLENNLVDLNIKIYDKNKTEINFFNANIGEKNFLINMPGIILWRCL